MKEDVISAMALACLAYETKKNPGTEIGSRVLYVRYGLNVWRTEERDVPL